MPKRKTILVEEQPEGPVTRATEMIPVLVHLRYALGLPDVEDHPADAVAWTATQVLVRWGSPQVEVWLPARDVRRRV